MQKLNENKYKQEGEEIEWECNIKLNHTTLLEGTKVAQKKDCVLFHFMLG